MQTNWLVYTTAFLLAPVAAGAERLSYGVGSEVYWTDNVYGTSDDEIDDTSLRALPWGQLEDTDGDFTGSLRYGPSYDYYLQESNIRGFDHDVLGNIFWRMGPRTSLSLNEGFRRTHTVARFNEGTDPGGELLLESRREPVLSNNVSAVLQHSLTPLDYVSLTASYGLIDVSDEEATDSDYLGSNLYYQHRLSERTSLGTRLSFSRQTSKPGEPLQGGTQLPDRETDYYNLSGVLNHDFSSTFHLMVSAGPTLISSNDPEAISQSATETAVASFPLIRNGNNRSFIDANTCPIRSGQRVLTNRCGTFDPPLTQQQFQTVTGPPDFNSSLVPIVGAFPSIDDTRTTYFADITLSKEWLRWTGSLSYSRSEDQNSNIGAVSDIIYGRLRWQPSTYFSSTFLASYERRTQATETRAFEVVVANAAAPIPGFAEAAASQFVRPVTLDNDSRIDVIYLSWQVSYRFTERTEVYSMVSYRDEAPGGEASFLAEDITRFYATIGIRYSFEPIQF